MRIRLFVVFLFFIYPSLANNREWFRNPLYQEEENEIKFPIFAPIDGRVDVVSGYYIDDNNNITTLTVLTTDTRGATVGRVTYLNNVFLKLKDGSNCTLYFFDNVLEYSYSDYFKKGDIIGYSKTLEETKPKIVYRCDEDDNIDYCDEECEKWQ